MKLRQVPGEHRYAVAVNNGGNLWLTLWVRRSKKGEFFVMVPRGDKDWNPHTSYHLDGTIDGVPYLYTASGYPRSSPRGGIIRTFFTLNLVAILSNSRQTARLMYQFMVTPLSFCLPLAAGGVGEDKPPRIYRNPIHLAREWQELITAGDLSTAAELSRKLGVSRARVTQVLNLLHLAPEVIDSIGDLGDPLLPSNSPTTETHSNRAWWRGPCAPLPPMSTPLTRT